MQIRPSDQLRSIFFLDIRTNYRKNLTSSNPGTLSSYIVKCNLFNFSSPPNSALREPKALTQRENSALKVTQFIFLGRLWEFGENGKNG